MSTNTSKIVSGTFWTSFSTIVTAVVQILRLSILTRFLDSAAFGIVAILTLILGLTNTFADLGFAAAIMHKQDITRRQFSSLYWIQFSLYVLIYLIISALSLPISKFYNHEELTTLLHIVLLDLIFYGIGRLYETLLLKKFQYKILSIRNIVCCILSLFVAFGFAFKGWGVYSLIFSTLSQTLTLNIWNFVAGQKYIKLKLCYDIKSNINLIKIGLYQTGSQILDYLSTKLDILILGKVLDTSDLGIYSLAKELVTKVYSLTNGIINKVLLPIFSTIQDDLAKVQTYYCRLLQTVGLLNFFLYMFMGVFAAQITNIIYGNGYNAVVPILKILSIWGLFSSIGNPIGNIVVAFGRTDKSFLYTVIRIVIYTPIIWYFATKGLTAMSISQVALNFLFIIVAYRIILKPIIKLQWSRWLKSFLPMSIITSTIIIVGFDINTFLINNGESILIFFFWGVSFCLVYALASYICYKNLLSSIFSPIMAKVRKRLKARI